MRLAARPEMVQPLAIRFLYKIISYMHYLKNLLCKCLSNFFQDLVLYIFLSIEHFGKERKMDNWIPENFVYIFEAKDLPSTTDDVMLDRVPSGQSSALS